MHVSRSGFYSWRSGDQSVLQQERSRLIPKVKAVHRQTRGSLVPVGFLRNYEQRASPVAGKKQLRL